MSKSKTFKEDLNRRYWEYHDAQFSNDPGYFERQYAPNGRPPVFVREESWRNVIFDTLANKDETKRLLELRHDGERNRWYGSMNSSQALAHSVLGNLAAHNLLHHLSNVKSDEGNELFGNATLVSDEFSMEHKINYLGEPRSTSLDGYIAGKYQIAIECKFTESELGSCSRPKLTRANSNYQHDYCDGTYSIQRERMTRCSLTERGILYWQYVPQIFRWDNEIDFRPCPLNKNYQLVRNVLAAAVTAEGKVLTENGHVVLIYDERNPAFQKNGDGFVSYSETQKALRNPSMLRKCSWQRLINYLRDDNILPWLTESLAQKYGI